MSTNIYLVNKKNRLIEVFFSMLFTVIFLNSFSQSKINTNKLVDEERNESAIINSDKKNDFLEIRNTADGLVVYNRSSNILSFNKNLDTLLELDGFEYYHWNIESKEILEDNSLVITGTCKEAWGNYKAIFTLKELKQGLILFQRNIYDEKNLNILSFEKLITNKINISNFNIFIHVNKESPDTRINYIEFDTNNLRIAKSKHKKMST